MTTITEPAVYEIHIEGYLDRRRVRQFGGMTATRLPDGVTALVGPVADQAALHGLIGRIRTTFRPDDVTDPDKSGFIDRVRALGGTSPIAAVRVVVAR